MANRIRVTQTGSPVGRPGRQRANLIGHTLVLSTSNGTKMVNYARNGASAIFMGTTLTTPGSFSMRSP